MVNWNHIIGYKLLLFDWSTWSHDIEGKLFVLDRNTWYHITVYKHMIIDNFFKVQFKKMQFRFGM